MDIDHEIEHLQLTRDVNLLRVSVVLKNTGKVKNVIRCEVVRIHQVTPLPLSVETNLSSLEKPMTLVSFAGEAWQPVKHLDWEQVKIWGYDYDPAEMPLVEPGEQDVFEYAFPISSDIMERTRQRTLSAFAIIDHKPMSLVGVGAGHRSTS